MSEFRIEFVIEGVSRKIVEHIVAYIISTVELFGGFVGGGIIESEVEDVEKEPA